MAHFRGGFELKQFVLAQHRGKAHAEISLYIKHRITMTLWPKSFLSHPLLETYNFITLFITLS